MPDIFTNIFDKKSKRTKKMQLIIATSLGVFVAATTTEVLHSYYTTSWIIYTNFGKC